MNILTGYVGTYTKGSSEGIYLFLLDTDKGKLSQVRLAAKLDNPTYLAISRNNKSLYSVVKKGESGGVAAFSIKKAGGDLKVLGDQLTTGTPPCHVSVDKNNRRVLSANYHKGTVELYPVQGARGIGPATSVVQHEGSGPNRDRQEAPHAHFAGFSPDEKYVLTVDLGTDQLTTYKIEKGSLNEAAVFTFRPGSGPRHLVFHPTKPYAYVMTEISSEVVALHYNAANGHFDFLQAVSAIPEDFRENSQGSAIQVTSDGRFVYAANRGHNSIAVFRVEETGTLAFVQHVPTEGDWPRDFTLDPTETFLIAANQNSGNLVLYLRNPSSGRLTLLQADIAVPDPVCVKFLHY